MRDITEVWGRIEAHQNEDFTMKRGDSFTYTIVGNAFIADRPRSYPVHVSQVEKALERVPVDGPQQLHDLRGPSYVWAILHDRRIRLNDW